MNSLINKVDLFTVKDERGGLVALEGGKNVPFDIKRIYYIFDTKKDVARGFHAHKKLQQVLICVAGKCRVILDDGKKREQTWLTSPSTGLLVGNNMWREMHDFSSDCVLLVLASEHYEEEDYIRDYDDFIELNK